MADPALKEKRRPVFLRAIWRDLAMLNWRVPPELLAPIVPRGTTLDTWNGDHWVSLVGLRFADTRVLGVPIPGHRDFPEINLRFHVRPEGSGRRGVVFVKELVSLPAVAVLAALTYNEPYATRRLRFEAPTDVFAQPRHVSYSWRHQKRWNRFGILTDPAPTTITEGSHAEFITEHHWGYTRQRDGSTIEYEVDHPRWRLFDARDVQLDVDFAAEYGPEFGKALRGPPDTVLFAEGSRIAIRRPDVLAGASRL